MSSPRLNRRQLLAASATAACASSILPSLLSAEPTAARHVPWLSQAQTPPEKLPESAPTLSNLLVDQDGKPITTVAGWEARRDELRGWWSNWLGSLGVDRTQAPKLKVLEEDRVGDVVRQLVQYDVEPGLATQGYLLRPAAAGGKMLPAVAVFHSTVPYSIRQPSGLEGTESKHFGLKLAQRGHVTFCPRNFLWSDNLHLKAKEEAENFLARKPGCRGMAKMLFNAQVAVDILLAQPQVDPARIGCVGHSLGAKEVIYLAAMDPRVKVTVSSEGGIGTRFSNWDAPWYLGEAIRDPNWGHEQHELLGLVAPRPFLLLGGDSADGDQSWPFISAALPVYQLYGKPAPLGLFNHKQGHAVPPEAEARIYEWFATYL